MYTDRPVSFLQTSYFVIHQVSSVTAASFLWLQNIHHTPPSMKISAYQVMETKKTLKWRKNSTVCKHVFLKALYNNYNQFRVNFKHCTCTHIHVYTGTHTFTHYMYTYMYMYMYMYVCMATDIHEHVQVYMYTYILFVLETNTLYIHVHIQFYYTCTCTYFVYWRQLLLIYLVWIKSDWN